MVPGDAQQCLPTTSQEGSILRSLLQDSAATVGEQHHSILVGQAFPPDTGDVAGPRQATEEAQGRIGWEFDLHDARITSEWWLFVSEIFDLCLCCCW